MHIQQFLDLEYKMKDSSKTDLVGVNLTLTPTTCSRMEAGAELAGGAAGTLCAAGLFPLEAAVHPEEVLGLVGFWD